MASSKVIRFATVAVFLIRCSNSSGGGGQGGSGGATGGHGTTAESGDAGADATGGRAAAGGAGRQGTGGDAGAEGGAAGQGAGGDAATEGGAGGNATAGSAGDGGGNSGAGPVSCAHPVALVSTVGPTFSALIVDDQYAYWYEPDDGSALSTARVAKVPVDGSGPAVELFNDHCGGVAGFTDGFASDANNIYIICYKPVDATHVVQIMTIPKNGAAPTPLLIRDYAGSSVCASSVGADGTNVYFSQCNSGPELYSIPAGGGAPTPLLPTMPYSPLVNGFFYIKPFGGNVYWQGSYNGIGSLLRAPAAGGAPVLIANDESLYGVGPYGIDNMVIRDSYFYWRNIAPPAPQGIWRLPLAGGTPTMLATIPSHTTVGGQLEIFENYIYFAEYDGSHNLLLESYPLPSPAAADAGPGMTTIIATIVGPAGFQGAAKNHVVANSTHLFISDPDDLSNNGHIYRCE